MVKSIKSVHVLFLDTKRTVLFCVITREGFFETTVESDEVKVAEGPILGRVCGWYNVWHGFAVAFKLVKVWSGLLMVLLNEYLSAVFSGAKIGYDEVGAVVVFVFSMIFWSLDLFGWFLTVPLFWIWLIISVVGSDSGIFLCVLSNWENGNAAVFWN